MTIAFIGLGHMGGPMAVNLVRAGHDVLAFDLVPELTERARDAGVPVAESAAGAAARADIVLTMLPQGRHVLAAYTGEGQASLLEAAPPDTLFLDCSTIAVDEAQRAAELAVAAGHRAMDAPVSGGVVGAENATLAFMVGGTDADFARVQPLLVDMGRRIVHCGANGLGQAAKVCNNLILGITQIAAAEGFVLGERLGLTHQVLFDVTSNASAQCWAISTNCPVPGPVPTSPANNDYQPGFAGALMAKDLGLAAKAIELGGVDAKLGMLAQRLYAEFAAGEGGSQDFSAIINTIRDASDS
jgi:3-hydroxyisobutyrate dehydrogenase